MDVFLCPLRPNAGFSPAKRLAKKASFYSWKRHSTPANFLSHRSDIFYLQGGHLFQHSHYLFPLKGTVCKAFLCKQHFVILLFYLEKAYDTVWQCIIMDTPHTMEIWGRFPQFLLSFLRDCCFCICVGNAFSGSSAPKEEGVLQGNYLTYFFVVGINGITSVLLPGDLPTLYVDDLLISFGSASMAGVHGQIYGHLRSIELVSEYGQLGWRFVVYSNSMCCWGPPVIDIFLLMMDLHKSSKWVLSFFCWLPGHVEVVCIEQVDAGGQGSFLQTPPLPGFNPTIELGSS